MLEDPFYWNEQSPQKRPRLIVPALIWLAVIVAAIVSVAIVAGCATPAPVPLCAKWKAYQAIGNDGSQVIIIDMENAERLARMLEGLRDGTCRLEKNNAT